MYLGSGLSDHGWCNCHPYSNCLKVTYVYRMLSCCWAIVRHVGSTLKRHWLAVVGAGVEESCVRSVLEWFCDSVVHNWPALNQQWAATLDHHWTEIGWVYAYRVYRRDTRSITHSQVSNGCWPEPVVVEWINVEDIYFNFSPWSFPQFYPEHLGFLPMRKTNTVIFTKDRSRFFVYSTHTA